MANSQYWVWEFGTSLHRSCGPCHIAPSLYVRVIHNSSSPDDKEGEPWGCGSQGACPRSCRSDIVFE